MTLLSHLRFVLPGLRRVALRALVALSALPWLAGCVGIADGISPVTGFELDRYLGRWYEIARLDHPFERGLDHVTAEYSRRDDGGVRVVNRGYSVAREEWDDAQGRAYFVSTPDVGHLKVSFFGPFYGSYVIFELDADYRYAFVGSYNQSYLWLLARTPQTDPSVRARFVSLAASLGFDTDALIWVDQSAQ